MATVCACGCGMYRVPILSVWRSEGRERFPNRDWVRCGLGWRDVGNAAWTGPDQQQTFATLGHSVVHCIHEVLCNGESESFKPTDQLVEVWSVSWGCHVTRIFKKEGLWFTLTDATYSLIPKVSRVICTCILSTHTERDARAPTTHQIDTTLVRTESDPLNALVQHMLKSVGLQRLDTTFILFYKQHVFEAQLLYSECHPTSPGTDFDAGRHFC